MKLSQWLHRLFSKRVPPPPAAEAPIDFDDDLKRLDELFRNIQASKDFARWSSAIAEYNETLDQLISNGYKKALDSGIRLSDRFVSEKYLALEKELGARAASELSYQKDVCSTFEFEWKRLDRLTTSISFQTGLTAVLGGGILYVIKSMGLQYLLNWREPPSIPVWIAVVAWIVQIWCLFRAWRKFIGYRYAYYPQPNVLKATYEALLKYYIEMGAADPKKEADEDYVEQMKVMVHASAQNNHDNNNDKAAHIHRASGWLMLSLVALAVSFALSMWFQPKDNPSVHQVHIVP